MAGSRERVAAEEEQREGTGRVRGRLQNPGQNPLKQLPEQHSSDCAHEDPGGRQQRKTCGPSTGIASHATPPETEQQSLP